jgi:hypothetical protein
MPFVQDSDPASLPVNPVGRLPEALEEPEAPSTLDTIAAGFRVENTIGSAVANDFGGTVLGDIVRDLHRTQDQLHNPDFDAFEGIEDRYKPFSEAFVRASNPDDVAAAKRRIDREIADRETLAESGVAGFAASFAAGLFDPIILVPVGGVAAGAARGGRSVLRGAYRTARAGLLGSTAAEAALHATQETRTWGESALNVSAATFLSGILGAGAARIAEGLRAGRTAAATLDGRAVLDDVARGVERDMAMPPEGSRDRLGPGYAGIRPEELAADLLAQEAGDSFDLSVSPRATSVPRAADPPISSYTVDAPLKAHPSYTAAKAGDSEAAARLVAALVKADQIEAARTRFGRDARYVPVIAEEATGQNAIPEALAHYYARQVGAEVEDRIVQASRAFHTGARPLDRMLARPIFEGPVEPGRAYVLVDDVSVMGGTMAELAHHIQSKGGRVAGVVTLANASRSGHYGASTAHVRKIEARYGDEIRKQLGVEPAALTADEARYILGFRDADALRAGIAKAKGEREQRLLRKGVLAPRAEAGSGVSPGPEVTGGPAGSVGAAATTTTTLAEESLKRAYGFEKAIGFASPILRTAQSPSIATRRAAQELADTPFYYEKNALGQKSAVSVESRVRLWTAPLGKAIQEVDRLFVKYRTGGTGSRRAIMAGDLVSRPAALTFGEFKEAIGQAMRRGDAHPVPEVAEAARSMRSQVFDPLKDRAIEAKLLPEDVAVETAVSYLSRVYRVDKINAQRPEFREVVTSWLEGSQLDARERVDAAQERLAKAEAEQVKLTPELQTSEQAVTEAGRAERRGVLQRERSTRDFAAAERELRSAQTMAREIEDRLERFRPDEVADPNDSLIDMIRQLRRGRPKEPQTLAGWLRAQGGLQDQGGELAAMGITTKTAKGLARKKGGMNLDDAALRAWEEGFFPDHAERPDIDEFLEGLRADFGGAPVIRQADMAAADNIAAVDAFDAEFQRLGIDVGKMSDAEIVKRLAAAQEAEAAGRAGDEAAEAARFREATPAARARLREIEFQGRVAERRLTRAQERQEKAAIRAQETEQAVATFRGVLSEVRDQFEARIRAFDQAKRTRLEAERAIEAERVFAGLERQELADISDQIIDRVTSAPNGRVPYEAVPLVKGPLRERTFSIPDEMIEPWLESDIETVARFYTRTMAPDVELAARFGSADMREPIAQIRDDYNRMTNRAKNEAARTRLAKRRNADVRDISAMRDRLRGTYAAPADPGSLAVRGGRVVRELNYQRLLGGMTASALPDLARPVMVDGIDRVFRAGVVPLVTNLRGYRLAADEVRLAGAAWDNVLDTRALSLADLGDDYGRHTRFERGLSAMTRNFGLVTLMSPWNSVLKRFSGVVTMSRILDTVDGVAAGEARRRDVERLAMSGIDAEMAGRIAEQFRRFGTRDGALAIAGTERWTDRGAVATFRAAVGKEVDRIIVTPGIGDRPLWMSSEAGKMIGQFKSFSMASAQRVALAGLQQRDAATLNGAILSVFLGMGVYALKTWGANRETSDDPAVWISEGVDRSGLTGWFFDVNNILEKGSRGTLGVNALVGGPQMSRYASRNLSGAVLGPTIGLVEDAVQITGSASTGDWRQSDTHALRRLLPYQNLFYMRGLFDAAEAGANDALGVPQR